MTLVDVNLLVYAIDDESPFHADASAWLTARLEGSERLGLPWSSLGGFLRISTNPRIYAQPLTAADAWSHVQEWLDVDIVWTPVPGPRHAELLGALVTRHHATAKFIPDAELAALALEHGLTLYSTDTDFARFTEIRWENPLAQP